jgi:hypothetical protein
MNLNRGDFLRDNSFMSLGSLVLIDISENSLTIRRYLSMNDD